MTDAKSSNLSQSVTETCEQTLTVHKSKSPSRTKTNPSAKRQREEDDDSTSECESQPRKAPSPVHYQDTTFSDKNAMYYSFSSSSSSSKDQRSESTQVNPVQQRLKQVLVERELGDEDEQKRKLAAAKEALFPHALATSFNEVADTLRNERRQEFCPIYKDETPEQVALRLAKRKPVGSLLAKRIRWDELKRRREEEERKAQMFSYSEPYGSAYDNQSSFSNPYEQYYATIQNQYDMMAKMNHAQQEYSGFWPEHQQNYYQNNDQVVHNSVQYQAPPYTYPYSSMNANFSSADYYYLQQQPPPPPPDEP
ncbi:unnamed protein product [Adineta ricciae]|uniref:Uncharacterized protein n=1 Tax=Adineta ricciae TaxID=249248 RepID=A0A814LQ96_ADIRI|nr:unnamed protein product [Adineta ricciae]CAF1570841.1 unnamed protein product [Adineta ricciae]